MGVSHAQQIGFWGRIPARWNIPRRRRKRPDLACPAFGSDTACGAIITVTPTGATVMQTGMGPYDGSDDTLIGVANMILACSAGAVLRRQRVAYPFTVLI
jgi:hypothetical protein